MGHLTLVWVAKAGVKEVDGQQGFVEVDSDIGDELIEKGLAQATSDGALHFAEIETAPPQPPKPPATPKSRARKKATTKKVVKEDDIETQ